MVDALLSIKGLNKRFGGLKVTDNVSLEIAPNQIHALIGPNGAGKTTLVAQIAGEICADDGIISFQGKDITSLPVEERASKGLVRSYQITSIFRDLTVFENLAISVQSRLSSSFHFFNRVSARRTADEVRIVSKTIGLESCLDMRASHLSHGQQRQLEIGLALALKPRLLLLDEPMAGLSADQVPWFVNFVNSLKSDDLSILLIEHDMSAVFQLSDTISVLVSGQRIFTGTPQQVRDSAEVRQAYLGDSNECA